MLRNSVFLGLLLLASGIHAFEFPIQSRIVNDMGGINDYFGVSVSLSGHLALVGSQYEDIDGNQDQGAAYLFDCSSTPCVSLDNFTAFEGVAGIRFGYSVSLSGSLALIGAFQANSSIGSAYLFDCASLPCTQIDQLAPPDGVPGDWFGISVSLSGTLALVGADRDSVGDIENQGSAYLFNCSSLPCSLVDKLTASDGAAGDQFGMVLSLSGSLALIGSLYDTIGGNVSQGSAYLFDCSFPPCIELDKLVASDGSAAQYFGYSVSLDGSMALIGVPSDDHGGLLDPGSAYLFDCSSFSCTQIDKLVAFDRDLGDWFGFDVSLSGSTALVGAIFDTVDGNHRQGSAYLFDCASLPCSMIEKITASDGDQFDNFGNSVSLSGTRALIGSPAKGMGGAAKFGSLIFFIFFSSFCFLL